MSHHARWVILLALGSLLALQLGTPAFATQADGDRLTASDGDALDGFGRAVAIDGETLVVGAPAARGAAIESGAVYVFRLGLSGWTEEAILKPAGQGIGELLGRSVAVSGDVIVAGAHGEDTRGALAGAAYVFERGPGGWTQTALLIGSDTEGSDLFGWSVAVHDDTIAVGARNQDPGASNAGAVYLFTRLDDGWQQQAKLVAADAAADDGLGWALALQGDRLLAGAPFDGAGSAYLFERSGDGWSQTAKLVPPTALDGDQVARSLALDAETALLGAPRSDAAGERSGRAYLFERIDGAWSSAATLSPGDSAAGDEFGTAVALAQGLAAIGAPLDDAPDTDSGSVTLFRAQNGVWSEIDHWTVGDGGRGDQFGAALGADGAQIAVGIPGDDTKGGSAGAAQVRAAGRRQVLQSGWNLVAWTGPESPSAIVAAPLATALDALFAWDATAQRFLRYAPAAPAFLNDLDTISAQAGLWVRLSAAQPQAWTVPFGPGPAAVALLPGFNLVAWTGADGAGLADAVAPLGDNLRALFVWDAQAQRFLSYRPGLPPALNTATTLQEGDGVWIDVGAPALWTHD